MPNDQHGPPNTSPHDNNSLGAILEIPTQSSKATWYPKLDREQQRFQIYFTLVAQIAPHNGSETPYVDLISPSD